ncbi:MAG: hypothetical protein M5R36_29110 [Deltaproteobacteria bacterium]|nr:hypothetical protein [Deltaproteobacteria bacterium]
MARALSFLDRPVYVTIRHRGDENEPGDPALSDLLTRKRGGRPLSVRA